MLNAHTSADSHHAMLASAHGFVYPTVAQPYPHRDLLLPAHATTATNNNNIIGTAFLSDGIGGNNTTNDGATLFMPGTLALPPPAQSQPLSPRRGSNAFSINSTHPQQSERENAGSSASASTGSAQEFLRALAHKVSFISIVALVILCITSTLTITAVNIIQTTYIERKIDSLIAMHGLPFPSAGSAAVTDPLSQLNHVYTTVQNLDSQVRKISATAEYHSYLLENALLGLEDTFDSVGRVRQSIILLVQILQKTSPNATAAATTTTITPATTTSAAASPSSSFAPLRLLSALRSEGMAARARDAGLIDTLHSACFVGFPAAPSTQDRRDWRHRATFAQFSCIMDTLSSIDASHAQTH